MYLLKIHFVKLIKDLEYHYPTEREYRSSHHNTYMQHSTERGTYAPMTTFSSAGYSSTYQTHQVRHYQQQQTPLNNPQQRLQPIFNQQLQQTPSNNAQQQLPSPVDQQQQQASSNNAQQQSVSPSDQQQPATSSETKSA